MKRNHDNRHVLRILIAIVAFCSSAAFAEQAGLTPAYLEGRWCYDHIDFGGQTEAVAIEYVFATDGTLEYQNSSTSERMKPGTWALADGRIEIKPSLMFFDLAIGAVEDDAFVLEAMGGEHRFLRGACGG